MFIDAQGNIYQGDMRIGDREATTEEVAAWQQSRQPSKAERIEALLAAEKMGSEAILVYLIENARTVVSLKLGVTDAQAHTAAYSGNPMYKKMVDLLTAINAIKAEA